MLGVGMSEMDPLNHKWLDFAILPGLALHQFQLQLPTAYKLICFDKNINGNRDVKILECDYLLVQRCTKLTLANLTVPATASHATTLAH